MKFKTFVCRSCGHTKELLPEYACESTCDKLHVCGKCFAAFQAVLSIFQGLGNEIPTLDGKGMVHFMGGT